MENSETTCLFFLRTVEFWPIFEIQISIVLGITVCSMKLCVLLTVCNYGFKSCCSHVNFGYILAKVAKLHFLENPQMCLKISTRCVFWKWNYGIFKIFKISTEMHFVFFSFSKWKKYHNLTFNDKFKMYSCALC